MPVTTGPFTDRLNQLVSDIGAFFSALGGKVDAIGANIESMNTILTQMVSPTLSSTTIGFADVERRLQILNDATPTALSYLFELNSIRNRLDTLNAMTSYLTQAGDGTPLQRNIQTLSDEVFRLGGALPNHATLFDLRQALVSPTGPRIQEIIEKLDILLDEKLGTAPNALTMAENLQRAADCVCELKDMFPPIEPPPSDPMIPAAHLCAPNAPILFTITPVDWYEWSPGLWAACPSSLNAGMEQWVIVQREFITGSGGTHPVLRLIDGQRSNALAFCNVTGASTTEIAVLEPQHGRDELIGSETLVSFGNGADVAGVTDGPNGCKTIALLNSELPDVYWRLNADLGGPDGSDRPNETYYFYEVVPN